MVREERALWEAIRDRIMRLYDAIVNGLLYWKWNRTLGPRGAAEKRLARELLDEIACFRFGGIAGAEAAKAFKKNYMLIRLLHPMPL